jgi:hypothetical protein
MFTTLTTWYPTLGKEGEMLTRGADVIRARQARGERWALLQRLFSATGPQVIVARQYREFGEIEAARIANQADPDFQAAVGMANALSRMSPTQRLRENIVPTNVTGAVNFVQTTYVYPALGNEPQLRSLLIEWVKSEQAKRFIGMGWEVYDPDGVVFTVVGQYANLAAVDEVRKANQADNAFQEGAAEVARLSRRPTSVSLSAVIVGFPQ